MMTFQLFEEVALSRDIPGKNLKKGDVATVVERHPGPDGETGYSLEVFNALGETLCVITVPESAILPLTENKVFSVRTFAA